MATRAGWQMTADPGEAACAIRELSPDPCEVPSTSATLAGMEGSTRSAAPDDDGRAGSEPADTPELLAAEQRAAGIRHNRSLAARIDAAIERTTDPGDLGALYTTRALALQGQGDASASAASALEAVRHFVIAGRMHEAANAAAMAAVFLDQVGDAATAVELAVEALVMLGDGDITADEVPLDIHGVRAALALCGFFLRQSAFDIAVGMGRRAFEGCKHLDDGPIDPVAFSFGYLAVEAANVTGDPIVRDQNIAYVHEVIDWLDLHGVDSPGRTLLLSALRAEVLHVQGETSESLQLAAAAVIYPDAPADLVAWHRLVRGVSALLDGRPHEAIDQLDAALPGLEDSSDNHCVVRALRARSEAFAVIGDHRRAYADALDLADRTRRWQIDQVGHLADQLARRAELERSSTELRETASRLTDDINHDTTTGIYSRYWLERHFDELGERSGRGSVIMCDIDWFKSVNDTYGHHVGDIALRHFAQLLEQISNSLAGCVSARFGGEEFVTLVHGASPATGAQIAEEIRTVVETHDWTTVTPGLQLSVSCGIASGPLSDVRELLQRADLALLAAKRQGRNRVITAPAASTD